MKNIHCQKNNIKSKIKLQREKNHPNNKLQARNKMNE